MSILLEKAREKVKKLEDELKDETLSDSDIDFKNSQLLRAKDEVKKYQKLELAGFDKIAAEMKIIKSHMKAVDDKYNCRSVKFLYSVADFFDKPRSKSLAKNIREYVNHKINAPVCSIMGNKKPIIDDMPTHRTQSDIEQENRYRLIDEIKKFRDSIF